MKFYRVHLYGDSAASQGMEWFTVRLEAERRKRQHERDERQRKLEAVRAIEPDYVDDGEIDECPLDEVVIKPTRAGILAALNKYASHPDNG